MGGRAPAHAPPVTPERRLWWLPSDTSPSAAVPGRGRGRDARSRGIPSAAGSAPREPGRRDRAAAGDASAGGGGGGARACVCVRGVCVRGVGGRRGAERPWRGSSSSTTTAATRSSTSSPASWGSSSSPPPTTCGRGTSTPVSRRPCPGARPAPPPAATAVPTPYVPPPPPAAAAEPSRAGPCLPPGPQRRRSARPGAPRPALWGARRNATPGAAAAGGAGGERRARVSVGVSHLAVPGGRRQTGGSEPASPKARSAPRLCSCRVIAALGSNALFGVFVFWTSFVCVLGAFQGG